MLVNAVRESSTDSTPTLHMRLLFPASCTFGALRVVTRLLNLEHDVLPTSRKVAAKPVEVETPIGFEHDPPDINVVLSTQ